MTFNRLADSPLPAVQLDRTLDLERGRVRGVAGDANQDEPFLVGTSAVVDDLRADECWMTVEDLLWGRGRVGDGPMVYSSLGDKAEG